MRTKKPSIHETVDNIIEQLGILKGKKRYDKQAIQDELERADEDVIK